MKKYYIVKASRVDMDNAKFLLVNTLGKKVKKWSDWAVETEDELYHFAYFTPAQFVLPVSRSDYDAIDLSGIINTLESQINELKRISSEVEVKEEAPEEPIQEAPVAEAQPEGYQWNRPEKKDEPVKETNQTVEFTPEQ